MEPSATSLPPAEQPNLPAPPELSEREVEVLRLVATGAGNKEIAQRLVISPNTVKVHVRNIFTKIGAASRTEATLYAIRNGLVELPGGSNSEALRQPLDIQAPTISTDLALRRRWQIATVGFAAFVVVVTLAVSLSLRLFPPRLAPAASSGPPTTPTTAPQWDAKAPMPTARTGMAVTTYADQIYVIGGETISTTTGAVERYDIQTDTWTGLAPAPTPATDIRAAVIAGLIYVPGGRLASGAIADQLNIYDPGQNRWQQGPRLPEPRSDYALAAYEGKLYLFGGWDGTKATSTVYEYAPDQAQWTTCQPLPMARSRSAAVVAGGKMYLIGGQDSQHPLEEVESFSPAGDCRLTTWKAATPLPTNHGVLDAVSLGDILYVFTQQGQTLGILTLLPGATAWASTPLQAKWITPQTRLASEGNNLHLLVGNSPSQAPTNHWAYRVYYAIVIPLITK